MNKIRKISKRERQYEARRRSRIKSGESLLSDVRSYSFWKKKYKEFLIYIRKNKISNPFRGGRQEFIDKYLSIQEELKKAGGSKAISPMRILKFRGGYDIDTGPRSYAFLRRKYKEFLDYLNKKGLKNPYGKGFEEFASNYTATLEQIKLDPNMRNSSPMKLLKYGAEFSTEYKTALAELKFTRDVRQTMEQRLVEIQSMKTESLTEEMSKEKEALEKELKELKENRPTLRELKTMTSKEFAEKNSKYLKEYYHRLRKEGRSSYEAKAYISDEFFGSP